MGNLFRVYLIYISCFIVVLIFHKSSYAQIDELESAPAVFEYDSLKIYTSGKKASFISVHFRRKYRVRIQNEAGASAFNRVTLPELHDQGLIFHAPKEYNAGKYLTNLKIEKFNINIIKDDGSNIPLQITPEYESTKFVAFLERRFSYSEQYVYTIDVLEPGDILELEYDYSALYSENLFSLLTLRIFFHSEYPILKKDVVFTKEKSLEAEVTTFLTNDPVIVHGDRTIYSWHFEDLPAYIQESGSRSYKSLPHFIISLKPYEMVYTLPYSFEERFIPFYVFGPALRENRHLTIVRAFSEGVNTKDYNNIRRFIKARIEGLPEDTTGYTQLYTTHNYIAENFTYDPDYKYYNHDDIRNERMGEYLLGGAIRDRCRYDLYVGLVSGLGLGYFTAYLADIRSGVISQKYFEPTISNDYLLAVQLNTGSIQFIYPKKERFGYFLNEIPFYFENTTARLIYLDAYRHIKEPIDERFLSIQTPSSTSTDNVRKQSASVNIDVDNITVALDASISLSGQFSTLGRGRYLYGSSDPTVNPAYSSRFGETFSATIQANTYKFIGVEQDFPYKAMINANFNADESLNIKNDTLYLDLNGWFNHILDSNLNAAQRLLPYYPDFKYTDTYTYQIRFSKDVEILDQLPHEKIINSYGSLSINSTQLPDGSILIMSKSIVSADEISVENIKDVSTIQDKVKALNKVKIRMRIK